MNSRIKKNSILFVAVILVTATSLAQLQQIGQDINGDGPMNALGLKTALSADGTILAVSAPFNNDSEQDAGLVRIYQNINSDWQQIGEDINGTDPMNLSGNGLALSDDGGVVAIGANLNDETGTDSGQVRVFENVNGIWIQKGQILYGNANFDSFGSSVALNADGNIMAVSATRFGSATPGYVQLYEFTNDQWMPSLERLEGVSSNDNYGTGLDLNSTGDILAISATFAFDGGSVEVVERFEDFWIARGNFIVGAENCLDLISPVRLSNDSNIIAIAGLRTTDGEQFTVAQIYNLENDQWIQEGEDIIAPTQSSVISDQSMDINDDATILALGAPGNFNSGSLPGHTYVYEKTTEGWINTAQVEGNATGDTEGGSVQLSANGDILLSAAPFNDQFGDGSGKVRVFNFFTLGIEEELLSEIKFDVYPNPATDLVNINFIKDGEGSIDLYNYLGQKVKNIYNGEFQTQTAHSFSTGNLATGMYLLKINTLDQTLTKKLLIN